MIYPTKQENLTNVISSPPPPLPVFDSSFDEESFYRNSKNNKKTRANSFHTESSAGSASLELPYKPKTVSINNNNSTNIKTMKKPKNKEELLIDDNESYHSSNENSVIWDAPINTFDSDNAMNELVRQTELFAEKTHSFEHNFTANSIPKLRTKSSDGSIHSLAQNRETALSTNWSAFRSSTPPASTSHHLIDDALLERRTPPIRFTQAVERPIPSNPWLKDLSRTNGTNTLDTELNQLRETSSPWNSQNSQTQQNWNCFAGIDSTKDLWNSSKWTSPSPPLTSNSSQSSSLWSDSFTNNLWNTKSSEMSTTWGDFSAIRSENTTDSVNANNTSLNTNPISDSIDSSFNLFGRSLWSPLTSTTNSTSVTTTTTTTSEPSTTPSTTWSFTPFSLFGSSSQTQYNRNSEHK